MAMHSPLARFFKSHRLLVFSILYTIVGSVLAQPEVPAHDDISFAVRLDGLTATHAGASNVGASARIPANELSPKCVDQTSRATLWYDWYARTKGIVTVDTFGSRVYVDHSASGTNDGSSWSDAFVRLDCATEAAVNCPVLEIWVAQGTYTTTFDPSSGKVDERNSSFRLRSGIGLYGGLAGGETERRQANPDINITILSGDLYGNDRFELDGIEFPGFGDNARSVVTLDENVINPAAENFPLRSNSPLRNRVNTRFSDVQDTIDLDDDGDRREATPDLDLSDRLQGGRLDFALVDGDYRWQVQARSICGIGPPSTERQFTVSSIRFIESDDPPTQVSPIGPLVSTQSESPDFHWGVATDTESYQLRVQSLPSKAILHYENYEPGVNLQCSDSSCTAQPVAMRLKPGMHQWAVMSINKAGRSEGLKTLNSLLSINPFS